VSYPNRNVSSGDVKIRNHSGRVALIEDKADFLFQKIANDEPLILAKANPGSGAVVADDTTATTEGSATPAGEVSTSPEAEPLPDWVQGTKASVKSCSK